MDRFGSGTIFALATPPGRSGIAVIRLTGDGAGPALEALGGSLARPRRAVLTALRDPGTGEALDRALTLWLPGPGSFTGEDMAELHVHGGRAVIGGVVEALGRLPGLRPAEAGAFTRRAFANGRLDLTEVEGLADLVDAETAAQRRQALRQMGGALGRLLEGWRRELVGILAHVEAAIDFSDEEIPDGLIEAVRPRIEALAAEIGAKLRDGHRGERLRDGFRVVLAGPPNAGKSSLLNALAQRDAAIVSEEAGTTRDVIDVSLDLGGYPVEVADTAGLREATGAVELEGVRRTLERARGADLVLWLRDASDADAPGAPADLGRATLEVATKCDLVAEMPAGGISVRTGAGLAGLLKEIETRAADALTSGSEAALTRARHRTALRAARDALGGALQRSDSPPELIAEQLRRAAFEIGRLTGRVDVEDLLDVIFADFCIGK
jgi:tRNA modification GTPase